MENNKAKVEIFGTSYNINGDAEPEYIFQLADYINKKMETISTNISNINPLHVAILAALNIADEYFQLKDIKLNNDSAYEEKAKMLISMLDEGIIGDFFPETPVTVQKV